MARIVLNTFGSFGDLHPYLALAIELRRRGHQPLIATSEVYRTKVEAEGVEFAPVRPDVGELLEDKEAAAKLWDTKSGSDYLLRDYLLPRVEGAYRDLLPVCQGADLILTHIAGYAGPVAAEKLNVKWISVVLQPFIFCSSYDPPVLAPAPWLRHLYWLGPWAFRAIFAFGRQHVKSWAAPLAELRKQIGLPFKDDLLLRGMFSPFGALALFSPHFAQPQPDWPPNTIVTGFVTYDKRGAGFAPVVDNGLAEFLFSGPVPVLFTLGSSAVMHPGTFYRESLAAAQKLGVRAVMLMGMLERADIPSNVPASVHIADYAPYSEIMPRVAATVHQGGIGTTAQALRAGRPMMVVPWAHDQPDNAERLRKLGVSLTIPRANYTAARAAKELGELLRGGYAKAAALIGEKVAREDGLRTACDAVETFLK